MGIATGIRGGVEHTWRGDLNIGPAVEPNM